MSIVLSLFALAGIGQTTQIPENIQLSRQLRAAILRILRPAESIARRLIYVLAKDLKIALRKSAPLPKDLQHKWKVAENRSIKRCSFQLFDPYISRHAPSVAERKSRPRITNMNSIWLPTRTPERGNLTSEQKDERLSSQKIISRLIMLQSAVKDMKSEAKRMARQIMRNRERVKSMPLFKPILPMRLGFPPGYTKRKTHPVHWLLDDSIWLADADFP